MAVERKKQCFISHCTADNEQITERFYELLSAHLRPECGIFMNSVRAGAVLSDELKNNLRESALVIALITDNYLRSSYCLAELAATWMLETPVIPVLFSPEAEKVVKEIYGGQDLVRLDAKNGEQAEENARRIAERLEELGLAEPERRAALLAELTAFFRKTAVTSHVSRRHYIGCTETERRILSAARRDRLDRMGRGSLPHEPESFFAGLSELKEVWLVATTGAGLVHRLKNHGFIAGQLQAGACFTILVPDRGSDFCGDVAAVEQPAAAAERARALQEEFEAMVSDLREAYAIARAACGGEPPGQLRLGCCFSLLRQTILMAVDKSDRCVGWVTNTIPPRKADGSFTMDFHGRIRGEDCYAAELYEHLSALAALAERRGCLYRLPDFDTALGFGTTDGYKREWQALYEQARRKTQQQKEEYDGVLIEVAAQHPLTRMGGPNAEFRARLDRAAELYRKLRAENEARELLLYVPGSVHTPDPRSLSAAGVEYLIGRGIPPEDVCGEEMNRKYMGEDGVYNSSDECYVASRIFFDGEFGQLHCVCSPIQVTRKELFYCAFGVTPLIHSVPVDRPYHNAMFEILEQLPYVLRQEHEWTRNPEGRMFRATRRERKSDYTE